MTVGVGIPDEMLEANLAGIKITKTNRFTVLSDLIAQQIAATEANIERYEPVSIYQENCKRWGCHLEAYRKIQDIIAMISK